MNLRALNARGALCSRSTRCFWMSGRPRTSTCFRHSCTFGDPSTSLLITFMPDFASLILLLPYCWRESSLLHLSWPIFARPFAHWHHPSQHPTRVAIAPGHSGLPPIWSTGEIFLQEDRVEPGLEVSGPGVHGVSSSITIGAALLPSQPDKHSVLSSHALVNYRQVLSPL